MKYTDLSEVDKTKILNDIYRHQQFLKRRKVVAGYKFRPDVEWEILLQLTYDRIVGRRNTMTTINIDAPKTTIINNLYKMNEHGLVQFLPDLENKRKTFVMLPDEVFEEMCSFFFRERLNI